MKIKSLAAEARIIRLEELRYPGPSRMRRSLYLHRVWDVRREQRASQLAYAFIRGRPYHQVEQSTHTPPPRARVKRLVEKFGPRGAAEQLQLWWSPQAADRCGSEPGVMTPATAGSTPVAASS